VEAFIQGTTLPPKLRAVHRYRCRAMLHNRMAALPCHRIVCGDGQAQGGRRLPRALGPTRPATHRLLFNTHPRRLTTINSGSRSVTAANSAGPDSPSSRMASYPTPWSRAGWHHCSRRSRARSWAWSQVWVSRYFGSLRCRIDRPVPAGSAGTYSGDSEPLHGGHMPSGRGGDREHRAERSGERDRRSPRRVASTYGEAAQCADSRRQRR
jgi:hypothetical protein